MTSPTSRAEPARRWFAVLPAVFALATAACSGGDGAATDPVSGTSTSTSTSTSTTPTADAAVDCASVPTGVSEFVLDAGGAAHDVRVYVPTTFDGGSELALVLDFHGFVVTGATQAALSGYEDFAEEKGFIVAHPTAVPSSRDSRNSWEITDFDDPAKDDVAFVDALLDLLVEDYCVDESRVYSTGMSGGGLFTSALVCDLSDRIAAASSVAALTHPDSCDPERPVPFMAIHGTEDRVVPFDGTVSDSRLAGEDFADELFSRVIPEEFAQFAETMGCDPEGDRVRQSPDIYATTYRGCEDGVPLVFYEVTNGGHTWPGTPLAGVLGDFQGYITSEIDATADSWAFFEQHTLEH